MEPEAVTDGQSTQRPSRGSNGEQTLHLLLPGTNTLGDEGEENKDEDEEDKEEDENDGSGCQHSPSSPPQRVRKGWRGSSSPPASSVRTDGQRASRTEQLHRDLELGLQDKTPKFLFQNAQTQHGKDDAMSCNQQIQFSVNFSLGASAFSVRFFF